MHTRGWTLPRAKYDDGGFSGGNTEHPALQRLLSDVQARKIDVIVVYKVDRLTRSLANFAKLVELFDTHNVSFVSVTQQFNTTTTAQCEHGFVKLVAGDWNQTFVDELCAFPNGAHDDQVDAASSAFRALMRRVTWHAVAAWSELRAGEQQTTPVI
jgi:Resolvase, N terminal domain